MYILDCINLMAWCIDNLLCKFYITVALCYDICNSRYIVYYIVTILGLHL